jgi:hypothetical protein
MINFAGREISHGMTISRGKGQSAKKSNRFGQGPWAQPGARGPLRLRLLRIV